MAPTPPAPDAEERPVQRCAICNRRVQGSWNHDQPYYRCKFPAEYAVTEQQHAKTVYVKEASIPPAVDEGLAGQFTDDHIDATRALLESTFGPDPAEQTRELAVRRKLKECTPNSPAIATRSKPALTPRSCPGGSRR